MFPQKVTAPLQSGLLLQLGEVAVLVCVFCAGQSHTGLCESPADSAALVPSPAMSGSELRQGWLYPGSPQRPWDTPPQQAPVATELQERIKLGVWG